ncbi:MAG: hypothetical protein OXF33_07715, partial [Rhodospirillales bacterium]|nr:hypothetical protein [Rhodospirillales bacterium]
VRMAGGGRWRLALPERVGGLVEFAAEDASGADGDAEGLQRVGEFPVRGVDADGAGLRFGVTGVDVGQVPAGGRSGGPVGPLDAGFLLPGGSRWRVAVEAGLACPPGVYGTFRV